MKQLIVIIACFFFAGCFEINEEIVIRKNGSGTLSVNTDMAQLLEMLQSFMGSEDFAKGEFSKARDTTIQMKSVVDTAKDISAETKALLRDGSMRLVMNAPQKKFNINLNFPFKHLQDLPKIYDNMKSGSEGMGKLLNSRQGNEDMPMAAPKMNQPSSFYDLEASKGRFVRRLNKAKYELVKNDSMMLQMKQMGDLAGAFGDMKMNTIIKLPKRAKTVTGNKVELSQDKKTVTVKATLMNMLERPEDYEFSVKY